MCASLSLSLCFSLISPGYVLYICKDKHDDVNHVISIYIYIYIYIYTYIYMLFNVVMYVMLLHRYMSVYFFYLSVYIHTGEP